MATTDIQPNYQLQRAISYSLARCTIAARSLFSLLARHCRGPQQARTAANLAQLMDIHPREINDLVRELRQHGIPVCASNSGEQGYFLPLTRAQAQPTLTSLERRFKLIALIRGRFAQGLDQWFGPPHLLEDSNGQQSAG